MTILEEIRDEISRQAAFELHKRSQGATVEHINESRAASYRELSKLVYGPQTPIIPWAVLELRPNRSFT